MLKYNGISIAYQRVQTIVHGPVKDPSGTDQLFTKITLVVDGLIYASSSIANSTVPVETQDFVAGSSPVSAAAARIRHMLTAPRKPLYYDVTTPSAATGAVPTVPNVPLINVQNPPDDNNGPWPDPDAFRINYVTQNTFEITWACTTWLTDCGPGESAAAPLSLRWEDSISYDKYWKATWQRTGTLIISARDPRSIDAYRRTTVIPGVPPGFRRVRSHYTMSKDNLRCDFTFTDEQMRYRPPYPVMDMDIVQSESFPLINGMRHGEVFINLKGVQTANPRDLVMWAIVILRARIFAARPFIGASKTVLGDAVIKTRETETSVEVSATARYKIPPRKERGGGILGEADGGGWLEAALTFGVVGGTIGTFVPIIGTVAGTVVGAAGGLIGRAFAGPPAPPGAGAPAPAGAAPGLVGIAPGGFPDFPWVGVGTSPTNGWLPFGYQVWANPVGWIQPPPAGVGLATGVALMGSILRDPCVQNEGFETELRGYGSTPVGVGAAVLNGVIGATASSVVNQNQSRLTALPGQDGLWVDDGMPGVYDHWTCMDEYHGDPGVIVMPTADPSGTNIAVRHSSKMMVLRRRWTASRTGAPPVLPPKDAPSSNFVLVGDYVAPHEIRVAADGASPQFCVEGVYEYSILNPNGVTKNSPVPPYISAAKLGTNLIGWVTVYENSGSPGANLNGSPTSRYQLTFNPQGTPPSGSPLGTGQLPGNNPF